MRQITTDQIAELLTDHEPPCVSLYQPTHRHHPDNQQDPIRYRNLLREMEASLGQKYSAEEVGPILEKFRALAHDDRFWNHRTDGLAILATSGTFQVFDLQRTVPNLLVVADSFHLKPLLRITQSADRYQILCLDRHAAKLFEGNRDTLDPVELTDMASTITDALGEELTEPQQAVRSAGPASVHHGAGQKKDEVDLDRDRFFRIIDRGILEHHSRPSGLPLMLAALTEYHAPFRAVSHNPHLLADGIMMNPDALDLDHLRAEAWRKMEPLYLARLAKLVDDYQLAKPRQLGSDDLSQVAAAATAGRVGTLLVEANRQIPGRLDAATGRIEPGELADPRGAAHQHHHHDATGRSEPSELGDPRIDDVLDDLAELTLRMKGQVEIVPAERMPATTGLAATYRF